MVNETRIAILLGAAFLPPIIYLIWIRSQEKRGREPWGRLMLVFGYGAIISVILALIFSFLLNGLLLDESFRYRVYDLTEFAPEALILAVIVAPVVEEFTKALGVRMGRPHITEVEDGIVYGVAAGLGFSATENLFYELAALAEGGEQAALVTVALRSITSVFLHATATGIVGYGMAKMYLGDGNAIEVFGYYIWAVLLHAAFNLIASLQLLYAVLFLIVVSFIAIRWTANRIRAHDTQNAQASSSWGR